MRLLLAAALFLLTSPVASLPETARAASTACGAVAGKTYSGKAVWAGGGTDSVDLTLKADCALTYVVMGSSRKGTWTQTENRIAFDLPAIDTHYEGELGGPILEGTMTTKGSKGTFRFVARANPAPKRGPNPACAPVSGAQDPTSRRYTGQRRFPGEGSRVMALTARFNADCSVTFTVDGREERGVTWTQDIDGVHFGFDNEKTWKAGFSADGVLAGAMRSHFGAEGLFELRPVVETASAWPTPPSPCLTNPTVASPAGQTWSGPVMWDGAIHHDMTVVFAADCSATYSYSGETHADATWSLNGATLSLIVRDGFARYDGLVVAGAIEGRMANGSDMVGQFRLSPASHP